MKNKRFPFLLLLVVFTGSSQIKYEKGYIIDNLGKKTNCFVRYIEWKNNPTEIQYKIAEDSEPIKGSVRTISEFSVLDQVKYVRAEVLIDRSGSNISYLSSSKEPEFQKETLFLKEVINGKAKLYSYYDSQLRRFFFSVNDSQIEQLVYKKYYDENKKIRENGAYKKQLWDNLKCDGVLLQKVQFTDYKEKNLAAIFNIYNSYIDPDYVEVKAAKSPVSEWLRLGVRAGIGFGALEINSDASDRFDVDFGNQSSLRFGLELEALLPFNRNKWSLILQPTYQSYAADAMLAFENVSVDYESIEVSLGVRHYFFLSPQSQLFLGSSLILDAPLNSNVDFENSNDLGIDFGTGASFTLGFKIAGKYSVEAIYALDRSILEDFAFISSRYGVTSIVLGYSFF